MLSLLKGLLTGLIISVPTGPIGFLCVKRTLGSGLYSGIVTGLGAVAADLVYGSVVIFGLSGAESFFARNHGPIEKIGAVILMMLGYATYFAKKKKDYTAETHDSKTLFEQWFTAFAITMTNPLQLVAFSFIFGAVNIIGETKALSILFLIGLLIGSLCWWIGLSKFVHHMRENFKSSHISLINHIAGTVIFLSGFVIILRSFLHRIF